MRRFLLLLVITLLGFGSAFPAAAADPRPADLGGLPRRAMLGVGVGPMSPELAAKAGGQGALILGTAPGGNAERLGVRTGDVVRSLNGGPVSGPGDLVAAAGRLVGGGPLKIVVWRDGKTLSLAGAANILPLEQYAGGEVRYGAVPYAGGLLRDILVMPKGRPNAPVVYYIQGYPCSSMEALDPDVVYGQVIKGLLARGIGVYRVEKPGVGDSRGGASCQTTDFQVELGAFQAGYDALTAAYGFDPDRIFMLGHSMGGLEAPLLAARRPPRGVAVYGVTLSNWRDYMQGIASWQGFEARGVDPVDNMAEGEALRGALDSLYIQGLSPDAIAAAHPDQGEALRAHLLWKGGDQLQGRDYRFWNELPGLPLVAAWRDTRSCVLSLYGASDTTALTGEDQKRIAGVVNHYRPGTASYVEVADTGHLMDLVGDRETARRREQSAGPGRPPAPVPFNDKVPAILADWIEGCMAKPPVRLDG